MGDRQHTMRQFESQSPEAGSSQRWIDPGIAFQAVLTVNHVARSNPAPGDYRLYGRPIPGMPAGGPHIPNITDQSPNLNGKIRVLLALAHHAHTPGETVGIRAQASHGVDHVLKA